MNNKSFLTLPCHWNIKVIDEIRSISEGKDICVKEIYGAMAKGGPVRHGRPAESVVNTTIDEALIYRNHLKEIGFKFTYLLNAPFTVEADSESTRKLHEYLDWVLNVVKPDAVTISSVGLMEEVRKLDKEIDIHVSTIAAIKNVDDLGKYLHVHPNRIITHHDLGKDWKSLKEIVNVGRKNDFDVEILINEGCLLHCPNRQAHYQHLSGQGSASRDNTFHMNCNSRLFSYPREFLLGGGVVRPEDIHFYEDLGVKYFKISGRSKPAEWLPEVVKAYCERKYDGNLVRLLGIDPSLKAETWVYIVNKSLEGFINGFPQDKEYQTQKAYCDEWIEKLYKEGGFKVLDGTIYKVVDGGGLVLEQAGQEVAKILASEKQ